MGHIRLGTLPRTRPWRDVVDLLIRGAPDEEVAAASAVAAEREVARAGQDPVFIEAVRLLGLIPQAAATNDFSHELRRLGMDVPDQVHLVDLLVAVGRRLDARAEETSRSDFGELSQRALAAALAVEIGNQLPGLFGPTAEYVRLAAARLRQPAHFARAARMFFGRLLADTLSSWLDRTLSAQVGAGNRFPVASSRTEFDRALSQYASEATRIINEFAGGWYGKTLYREGTISSERAGGFAAIALKKIGAELRRKRAPDG